MEFFIHVGTNKTGTSAIQAFLHRNPNYLRAQGILYPTAGRDGDPAHHKIAHLSPQSLHDWVAEVEREAEAQELSKIVLSSEAFHTTNPENLLFALSRHSITTIAFVRDHPSYFSSWYRESIKNNYTTRSLYDFVRASSVPYGKWLREWPNTQVFKYDRKELLNHSVVDQFMYAIDPEAPTPPPQWDENASISGNLLFAKQVYNNFITPDQMQPIHQNLMELLKLDPTFTGSMHIPDKTYQLINKKYAYDREVIKATYDIDLTPPASAQNGNLTPDLSRWDQDLRTILAHCQENDYLFGKLLSKVFRTNF